MCILFVEDDPLITLVCEDAFQNADFEVMTADNAPAAMRLIEDHPGHFICLVTDIHMPGGGTGFDVVEHMRKRYWAMPILVVTGRPDTVHVDWRRRHGVTLLTKPYGANLMIGTVNHMLNANASTRLEVTLKGQQLKLIEEFQRSERLLSREAAVSLLLEIALEAVTGTGDRFWDKSAGGPLDKLPRR